MDAAVTTGLFALGGVIVGGVVNGTITYAIERSREGWAARRSARMFGPALHRLHLAAGHSLDHPTTWAELAEVVEINLDAWPEHADVFAGSLDWDQWFEIYAAVRAWEQFTWNLPPNPDQTLIRPGTDDAKYIDGLIDITIKAAVQCAVVGIRGVRQERVRNFVRNLRYRVRPPTDDELIEEVLGKQDPLSSPEDS